MPIDKKLLERIASNGKSLFGFGSPLKEVNLRSEKLVDEDAIALAKALKTNHSITVIHLDNNQIGAEGAKALADAFTINKSITSIYLYNNYIGAEGAKALA